LLDFVVVFEGLSTFVVDGVGLNELNRGTDIGVPTARPPQTLGKPNATTH
jgi:hypothetical protein